ncbi:uncharacterized protein LOC122031507 [Zingiber officinale]|uniref:Uncharacterized protein n=1 Tax=Zingiber officinale TaxID=94328 RepID=A0A8J5ENV5_ZINOF|nr:uncharacterized protein LOC122031507 [Zingiber officinale]KAG6470640.1 hypothetical protein ZIOFF_071717 [Zingiber officinale]
MDRSGELKRHFEVDADETAPTEVKRLRVDFLFDILDDDAGPTGEQDLASVMKSLEEEISLPSPADLPAVSHLSEEGLEVARQPDLGFLYEASDDELGLPPADAASSADESGAAAEADVAGFSRIWGFDDAVDGYDGLGLGMRPEERAFEGGQAVEGGLFDYTDEIYGPYDLYDLTWRTESLPAV